MDIEKYDFESALEAGFKTLFDAAGLALRVADDIGQGELPDERITLEIDTGGPISDEHQNAQGIYDNYAGTIAVEIHTPRVPNDQTAAAIQQIDSDVYTVYGAGTKDANGLYVRNGNSADGNPAYTLYDSEGTTVLYNLWSLSNSSWYISSSDIDDLDGLISGGVYANTSIQSPTPSESGWVSANESPEPAPLVQALSEIGEYIGHWNGEIWASEDAKRGQAYPDHNGIKIANCKHGNVAWVAYKKAFTDTYGDGTNGTVSDIPSEWLEFMSYDAARAYAASQGSQDGYNPVAIRDVERAMERALMKVSRQGINETIALYFRTNYGYDVSVNDGTL